MKIGILTSSRADFGIYYPLLKEMSSDPYFDMSIICFGTHLSEKYGNTANEILEQGFKIKHNSYDTRSLRPIVLKKKVILSLVYYFNLIAYFTISSVSCSACSMLVIARNLKFTNGEYF